VDKAEALLAHRLKPEFHGLFGQLPPFVVVVVLVEDIFDTGAMFGELLRP
jgi:hypothetical protein